MQAGSFHIEMLAVAEILLYPAQTDSRTTFATLTALDNGTFLPETTTSPRLSLSSFSNKRV
jgi:hypothetical protein